ncbi:uncharacterized protein LOC119075558 [Bradysia coprophila]|uniref:uncharacterized protein LOC119075558 n=1 Tax=Bradysia coprophila TaxID=38358 RepID=UPI00187DD24B|nr:uncharacterized protein LOC119075558 [Bradysia coprophila]
MRILLIVLMYYAATTYAVPLSALLGGLTNNRPRYGSTGGSSISGGLLKTATNSASGTGSSGGLIGGLLGAKPPSAPSKLTPLEDPVESVASVINVPYPVENIGDVAVTATSETLPVKYEPKTSPPIENVSPSVNVESVTVTVDDATKTIETPIVDATDSLPTNAVPLNDFSTVGSVGGSSGGLLAEATQALPIGSGSSGLLTNLIADLTKILPVGRLLGNVA